MKSSINYKLLNFDDLMIILYDVYFGELSTVTLTVSIGGTGKKTFASKIGGERSLFFCHELEAKKLAGCIHK